MTAWTGSRRRLLQGAASVLALGVAARARAALHRGLPLAALRVESARPYAGDRPLLATASSVRGRRRVRLRFRLARQEVVSLDVLTTGQGVSSEQPLSSGRTAIAGRRVELGAGERVLDWAPPAGLEPRTYILRLTAAGRAESCVVRLLGVDAGFAVRSVRPGDSAVLVVRSDARALRLQLLHCGPEADPTYANDQLKGVPVGAVRELDWHGRGDAPAGVYVRTDPSWPSGVYAARLDADDGRVGFAPLVLRPAAPAQRVAVVVPTTTWQAYNFYDADGDGWGDTWYARWKTREVDLTRPHANRGVPYRFRSYDLGFLHWLARTGKAVDVYADEDLERFSTPDALRAAYGLLVFPGHTEYVTTRLYDLVQGYRDRGGNLAFLSANNFFRRVDRRRQIVRLVDEWRDLGRPEAALCGVQYLASDRGERHAPFTVVGADAAPWAFESTGLGNGAQFGLYGIEIDARAGASPPGVQVLATIPDLFGPGRSAEMTYYEHASGARVFSAGVLNFGGQVTLWPQTTTLLENVWRRLTT